LARFMDAEDRALWEASGEATETRANMIAGYNSLNSPACSCVSITLASPVSIPLRRSFHRTRNCLRQLVSSARAAANINGLVCLHMNERAAVHVILLNICCCGQVRTSASPVG